MYTHSILFPRANGCDHLCFCESVGLTDTVQEIRRAGGKCWGYYCDIANRGEVYRIAKTVEIEVGSVRKIVFLIPEQ